jgi:hypothetical protein
LEGVANAESIPSPKHAIVWMEWKTMVATLW